MHQTARRYPEVGEAVGSVPMFSPPLIKRPRALESSRTYSYKAQ